MANTRLIPCLLILTACAVVISTMPNGAAGDESSGCCACQSVFFYENFDTGTADRWEPTDASAWKVVEQDGNFVYNQFKKRSDYKPTFRSPYNRSLIKDVTVSDFALDVKLQSTHPDYGHRDMCLFFGYQDDAHLYYVHLGKKMDPHANNIFIVNGAARKSISLTTTKGTDWDDNWHHVRIVRNVETGSIQVFFDDLKHPVMTAIDTTFKWGRLGLGSFDDTGNFDSVLLSGHIAGPPKAK